MCEAMLRHWGYGSGQRRKQSLLPWHELSSGRGGDKIIGKTDNIPHDDESPRKNKRERGKIGSLGRGVNVRLCVQGSPY